MTPDQSLHPCLRDKSRNEEKYLQTRPAVVLETAASQKLSSVMSKAVAHLYRSNNEIKAVIICNLTHPIPLQPSTYKAEIAVWVRELMGDVGMFIAKSSV
jgi:adenylosuccinate lyase